MSLLSPKGEKKWMGIKKPKLFRKGSSSSVTVGDLSTSESSSDKSEASPSPPTNRPRSVSTFVKAEGSHSISHSSGQCVPRARRKPQFGTDPSDLFARYPDEPVPAVVVACVEVLDQNLLKEGLFRIPGRMTDILEMKISFEQGKGLGIEEPDPHAVAGLLAQFFRELPEPLLTHSLYHKWVAIPKMTEEDKKPKKCVRLLRRLPPANHNLLTHFIEFLTRIAKHSGANRMGARNLALVFGASLLNPADDEEYDLVNIKAQCDLVELMINHYSAIFQGTSETYVSRAERAVATIPAGIRSADNSPATHSKKKFFERPQLSGSTPTPGSGSRLRTLTASGDGDRRLERRKKRKPSEPTVAE